MDYGSGKTFEEQEIIEHYVTECRRTVPISHNNFLENGTIQRSSTAERSLEEQTFSQTFRNGGANDSLLQSTNGFIENDTEKRCFFSVFFFFSK